MYAVDYRPYIIIILSTFLRQIFVEIQKSLPANKSDYVLKLFPDY